jgi:hypothetical protein
MKYLQNHERWTYNDKKNFHLPYDKCLWGKVKKKILFFQIILMAHIFGSQQMLKIRIPNTMLIEILSVLEFCH